jgi:hypothetical protein
MVASFAKVDQVVAGTGTTQNVPVLSGSPSVNTFVSSFIPKACPDSSSR